MDRARTVSENRLEGIRGLLDAGRGDASDPPRTNGGVEGHHVILVGRIDPMEHVEPVYGGGDDDDDAAGDDCWGYSNGDLLHGSFKATPCWGGDHAAAAGAAAAAEDHEGDEEEEEEEEEGGKVREEGGGLSLASLLKGGKASDWPYSCPVCRRRFARYGHYARHLQAAHHHTRVSEDDSEDTSSEDRSEVGRGDDLLAGQQGASFMYGDTVIFKVSKEDVQQHQQQQHQQHHHQQQQRKPRSYVCRVCGDQFCDRESRARHVRDHQLFHCEVCGRGFKDKGERDHHSSMYTGKPAHRCKDCGKHFHLTHSFARHMRTHTGEQPFSCEVCGKRFNDSGNMAKHLRTHSSLLLGELPQPQLAPALDAAPQQQQQRPFPCEVCGRGFANASNLARHFKANHHHDECHPR